MDQTLTDWELLVIDDGSSDGTCAVVEQLAREDERIRFLKNEKNMGAAATRNRGFELCRGDFVALLDSDDIWAPEKLSRQLDLMQRSGAELCYSSYAVIDGTGNKAKADYLVPETVDFEGLLRENVIGCSTVMLRRSIIEKYRFHTDYFHEDYVLWLQLLQAGYRAVGCGEVLVKWRLIETSRSFNKLQSAKNRWKIYRDYLHLPLGRSIRAFAAYMTAGLKKYGKSA